MVLQKKENMKKVEKKQWFIMGLQIIENEGVSKITIDNLCNLLEITKGAFYHHFKNIDGYIDALMAFWLKESTLKFIENVEKLDTVKEKLYTLSHMSASSKYKCEGRIRGWSYTNNIVQQHVKQVDKLRLDYLTKLFQNCGYEAEYAHKRATIQYCLLIGLQHICSEIPVSDFNELQSMLIERFEVNAE